MFRHQDAVGLGLAGVYFASANKINLRVRDNQAISSPHLIYSWVIARLVQIIPTHRALVGWGKTRALDGHCLLYESTGLVFEYVPSLLSKNPSMMSIILSIKRTRWLALFCILV